jgi:hypothetical protein
MSPASAARERSNLRHGIDPGAARVGDGRRKSAEIDLPARRAPAPPGYRGASQHHRGLVVNRVPSAGLWMQYGYMYGENACRRRAIAARRRKPIHPNQRKGSNLMTSTQTSNRISLDLPAGTLADIMAAIKVLQTDLVPYLVELGPDDRRALSRTGPKSIDFVNRVLEQMQANPELKPGFVDLDEFARDLAAMGVLRSLLMPLQQIVDLLGDSLALSSDEAYSAALVCYHATKGAARLNTPGAKVIADDLARQFAGRGRRNDLVKPPAPAPQPAATRPDAQG